jgi:hypothetical protein
MPLILGKTKCNICGETLLESHNIVSFWAFVPNQNDSFWQFSDRAFHENCFLSHPLATQVSAVYQEWQEKSANKVCAVCNQPIVEPDDYIGFGYLTNDKDSPIYPYNHLHFHRQHLGQWSDRLRALTFLEAYQAEGKWKGEVF